MFAPFIISVFLSCFVSSCCLVLYVVGFVRSVFLCVCVCVCFVSLFGLMASET